jgi:hypothetical protein
MTEAPKAGTLMRYPYLWARQADSGEAEGRKRRPCAVVLALMRSMGKTELRLCAVTTQPPQRTTRAVPVPEIEKRRAGLDAHIPLWVIIDEHNVDVFEQSFYIEPNSQLGVFSATFTKELQLSMIRVLHDRAGRIITRSEV